ncbi:uncharacterized protein K460DRAFT_287535 [Cucurbitaria berberidis CBS 394.84]|uniref:Uncharacterized protein n=1 Tax=Cucurbitaria berberidis CBS 394.84 TaxID=1168544 RepID=A0A9P4GBR9_9PLEO|nr:uncharacterized protein K460DRAFT_287535 [Cucurbitaria berberidis CBS 394.84]KAF1842943.1 hypothetical protein K460DRAFT_287535 [Cucurbitaria berberidis CBS 394.84]
MPLALFQAVSSKPELLVAGQVTVPEYVDLGTVKFLIGCINLLPSLPRVNELAATNDTFRDVCLCSAADALGMGTFTQRIFDTYFKRVNSVVPNAANINAITSIRTPQGNKLFGQIAYTIAKKLWEKNFENGDDFKTHYLPTNPRLGTAIDEWFSKFELKAARVADFEKREGKAEKADRIKQEHAKEKAARISYREKKPNGIKVFTFAEARYAYKYLGIRIPIKAG